MLKKAYYSKDLDNCVYELNQDFPEANLVYCSDLAFNEFCLLHNHTLLNSDQITAFVGVDKFRSDNLLNVLNAKLEVEVCWLFKKMDKRTKIYKSIKATSSVEECTDLSNKRKKKAFVSKCFKEAGILPKFSSKFIQVCSDSKPVVVREVNKFKIALESLSESKALRSLIPHKVDSNTMNFISTLFSGTEVDAISLISRVDHVPVPVLSATLLKRTQSYIYLSLGNYSEAKKYWDRNGYYLNPDCQCANKIGYKSLLDIYLYIDQVFNNFLTKDPEYLRLSKLVRYVHSLN